MAIFLIVFVILFFFVNSFYKRRSRARIEKEKADAIRNRPPADKLSLAKMYFGTDWDRFYQDIKPGRRATDTFYNIVAFALTKLAPSDLAAVIIQFGMQTSKALLFQKTSEMIDLNIFTADNMATLFHQIVQQNKSDTVPTITTSEIKKVNSVETKADPNIIDVTGRNYRIDQLKFPDDPPLNSSNTQINYSNYLSGPENQEWLFGNKYKEKLSLKDSEVRVLNKLWNPSTVFLNIEACCVETIRLFLSVLELLEDDLKLKSSSLQNEFENLRQLATTGNEDFKQMYWLRFSDPEQLIRIENTIYGTIFKRGEMAVRDVYQFKRKVFTGFTFYNPAFEAVCETRVGEVVNKIITSLIPNIKPPTTDVEEKLNTLSVNRWKLRFEELVTEFKSDKKEKFIKDVNKLGNSNRKNPNLENIYFDAAKFMSAFDRVEAVKFYIQYIYYDLLSDKIDKKPFSKTVLKLLFKTPDQQSNFDQLITTLGKSKDLDKTMAEAEKVFKPRRRKIQLDESVVSEVIREDHNTVELLNAYLEDDPEEATDNKKEVVQIAEPANTVIEDNKATLDQVQLDLLTTFKAKSYTLSAEELTVFCKERNLSMNQLIDNINECCYEILDDLIIESDGNRYQLNEKYYQQIIYT